ncbi:2-octaprenyl-6-methoxyphenol hydroxylase /2-octaprenyl-3-methyl-6-methoxy-1,4-benzoquinol hydroxylase [Methylobacillus rhizosphaerae]|uniref:2-octaprenyl-6-methoxyphenol hydroxylase /2-octaprenyl-3-methyl-6-methoxy-1,4-benzoquinol hydroxylase n=1 Tax=Methylobacillus rhizosphaerae TaxID=551994 RepID=A0A238Y2J2_9PROT|nr:FAD-dependent oxidoreductase [Methylobacillus rhizosphaerae]SNR65506.1 2-octaprenyl-6-methoxyphenol hydroxylase /2-octaprenyl-3-methyl-6-methoxy-1,4-benzoquinol hydroxylase [Methylobacillus rhizosphaerae]
MSEALEHDILIVGGGPVGATLALALQYKGYNVTMLEARAKGAAHHDQRALALSYGSILILEKLGLWSELEPKATAIKTIHVSQRGSLGRSLLKAEEHGQSALGYVLAYGDLSAALDRALQQFPDIHVHYEAEALAIRPGNEAAHVEYRYQDEVHACRSRMAVLADGGRSLADIPGLQRETKQYGHDALVSKVKCELPHGNIAYERFTPAGPVALLPNGERDFSLVWTGKTEEVQTLLALDDEQFLEALHTHFGDRLGRFLEIGKRLSFPLKLSYLKPVTAPHLAVIGNAAQTMHPVAGQGFNVGMRDAWELAQLLAATPVADWGGDGMLRTYQAARKADTRGGLMFTDFLVNVFSNDIVGLRKVRALGLGLLDIVPFAKKRLVGKMSFGPKG